MAVLGMRKMLITQWIRGRPVDPISQQAKPRGSLLKMSSVVFFFFGDWSLTASCSTGKDVEGPKLCKGHAMVTHWDMNSLRPS